LDRQEISVAASPGDQLFANQLLLDNSYPSIDLNECEIGGGAPTGS
jgi:hypothetical protein